MERNCLLCFCSTDSWQVQKDGFITDRKKLQHLLLQEKGMIFGSETTVEPSIQEDIFILTLKMKMMRENIMIIVLQSLGNMTCQHKSIKLKM